MRDAMEERVLRLAPNLSSTKIVITCHEALCVSLDLDKIVNQSLLSTSPRRIVDENDVLSFDRAATIVEEKLNSDHV